MKERTVYYSDLLNDDFAGTNINTKELPADYQYFSKNPVRRGFACAFYHAAGPLVWLLQKIVYGEKVIGREKLKPYRKEGFFLYGNHTQAGGDPLIPNVFCYLYPFDINLFPF